MDQYIFIYLPKYLRSVLAQFKCEILQIRVETGGHKYEALSDGDYFFPLNAVGIFMHCPAHIA